jgi:hypothetical protein
MIGAISNQDWFLSTIYFLVDAREFVILDASFIDREYPALNGHRCMFWVYRSLNFVKKSKIT